MKDYRGAAALAQDLDDEEEVAAQRGLWEARARSWLRSSAAAAKENEHDQQWMRKRYRTKAYEWLLATDHALQQSVGHGWSSYCLGGEVIAAISPLRWPTLVLAPDQGPDGWAALMYLKRYKNANVEETPDISHGVWNDVRLALKDCSLWQHVRLMTIIMNASYGPWCDARWFKAAQEAVQEYLALAMQNPEQEPLLQYLLPAIQRDRGHLA
jgi:hypothetical protein